MIIKKLNHEFIRFLVAGGLNTGITYVLYVLLNLALPYTTAYTIAYLSGIGFSYFLASRFVFNQQMQVKKAMFYPIVYLVQYLCGLVILSVLVDTLKVSELLAVPAVIILTLPVTYILSKLIVTGKISAGISHE